MKATDLREKSLDDLGELERTLANDVFQNRMKNFTNRLDDTSAIRKSKKDLARVKTLLREASLGLARKVAAKANRVEEEAKPVEDAKAEEEAAKPSKKAKAAPESEPQAEAKAEAKPAKAKAEKKEAAEEKPKKAPAKKTKKKDE
jgi:ribosomal protein L29